MHGKCCAAKGFVALNGTGAGEEIVVVDGPGPGDGAEDEDENVNPVLLSLLDGSVNSSSSRRSIWTGG